MNYTIYFMRGNKYEIEAISASEAFRILHNIHPETISWDVLKVMCNGIEV